MATAAKMKKAASPEVLADAEKQMATTQDQEIRSLWMSSARSWTKLAILFRDFQEHERWRPLGYKSIRHWLKSIGISHGKFYGAMKVAQSLKDVPAEELAQVPQSNAYLLKQLPESKRRDPEVIHQAQTLPEQQFAKVVETLAPDSQPEVVARRTLVFPVSLWGQIDEALTMIGWQEGTEHKETQWEAMVRAARESYATHGEAHLDETLEHAYWRVKAMHDDEDDDD